MNYSCPPYLYLSQVAEHCPKALSTYLVLWREKGKDNSVHLDKSEIRQELLISLAKFRHDTLLLVKEGLISVDETPSQIHIELVDYDFDADEPEIC